MGILEIYLSESTSYAVKLNRIYSSRVRSTPRTSFYKKNSFFREKLSKGSLKSTSFGPFFFRMATYCYIAYYCIRNISYYY